MRKWLNSRWVAGGGGCCRPPLECTQKLCQDESWLKPHADKVAVYSCKCQQHCILQSISYLFFTNEMGGSARVFKHAATHVHCEFWWWGDLSCGNKARIGFGLLSKQRSSVDTSPRQRHRHPGPRHCAPHPHSLCQNLCCFKNRL